MVYEKGQLVALAVGGGGAVVAAVVLAYLIKKYRESTSNDDDGVKGCEIQNGIIDDDDDVFINEASRLSPPDDPSSGESTPTTSAWTAGDFRPSFELERPIDFVRLSQSSGITEVESPSFEELIAIEREVVADDLSDCDFSLPVKTAARGRDENAKEFSSLPGQTERPSDSHSRPLIDTTDEPLIGSIANKAVDASSSTHLPFPSKTTAKEVISTPENEDSDDVFEVDSGVVSTIGSLTADAILSDDNHSPSLSDVGISGLNANTNHFSPDSRAAIRGPLPAVVTDNVERLTLNLTSSPSKPSSSHASSTCSSPRPGSATLDDIEEQTTVLSPSESRALVAFLGSVNPAVVRRALLITVNAATFPANRYFLRRAGCIPVLNKYLDADSNDEDVVEASVKALSNLAVDEANLEYMKDCLAPLMVHVRRRDDESTTLSSIRLESLICLTNMTKTTMHHESFTPFVDELLGNVDEAKSGLDARLQSLKILINLSLNSIVTPTILRSRSLTGLSKWLALTPTGKPHQDASHLEFALNVCHLLSNLLETTFGDGSEMSSSSSTVEWMDDVVEREETLLGCLASEVKAVTIRSLLFDLNRHPEPDVRFQGKRLYALLAPLWRRCRASIGKAIVEEES